MILKLWTVKFCVDAVLACRCTKMADGTGQFVDVQTEDYSVCDVKRVV